jgi:pyruvate dehydrogenase complex dehydrogenase (E1) component
MKVDQEEVTTAIAVGRSVAQGDDAAALEATVRLARRAGPDAVKFLRRVVVTEGWSSVPQRVRASCALLEVGGHLGGSLSSETRSNAAFREPEETDRTDAGGTS